ncbi:ATP-binding protein [Actinomadura keratinilytica]|uniref:ATP-binding protein n=1 Tax=Actinomadura keratinilytica TaxID=547461 RepID=A0ABP7ZBX8_9ACTN
MLLSTPPTALYWRRSFPGDAEQARAARRFTSCLLAGFPALDEVLLTVDELVVNALRHTKSGQGNGLFTLEVLGRSSGVAVAVTDQGGPGEPAVRDVDELAESGRGLRTVSHLATSWGWYGDESGRTVTAMFAGEWLQ